MNYICSQSGDWNNPLTWGNVGVPGINDTAKISGNYTVNLNGGVIDIGRDDVEITAIEISAGGKLVFPVNANQTINCNGRFLVTGVNSELKQGTSANPIQEDYIARINMIMNGSSYRRIFSVEASAIHRAYGSRSNKKYFCKLALAINAGSNTAVLTEDLPLKANDELYFMSTADVNQGELFNVNSYDSLTKTVMLSRVATYNHNTECFVWNLTRNVILNKRGNPSFGTACGWHNGGWLDADWFRFEGKYSTSTVGYSYPSYRWGGYSMHGTSGCLSHKNMVLYDNDLINYATNYPTIDTIFFKTIGYAFDWYGAMTLGFRSQNIFCIQSQANINVPKKCYLYNLKIIDYNPGSLGTYAPPVVVCNGYIDSFQTSSIYAHYTINLNGDGYINNCDLGYPVKHVYCLNIHQNQAIDECLTIYNCRAFYTGAFIYYSGAKQDHIYNFYNMSKNGSANISEATNGYMTFSSVASDRVIGNCLKIKCDIVYNYNKILKTQIFAKTGILLTVRGWLKKNSSLTTLPIVRLYGQGFIGEYTMLNNSDWQEFSLSVVPLFSGLFELSVIFNMVQVNSELYLDAFTVDNNAIDLSDFNVFYDKIFPPLVLKTEYVYIDQKIKTEIEEVKFNTQIKGTKIKAILKSENID